MTAVPELIHTTNAKLWAEAFLDRFRGQPVGEGRLDEGALVGWFANALATGERLAIPDLVGLAEIAQMAGVKHHTDGSGGSTVRKWRQRGLLPPPEWDISGAPIWRRGTISRWLLETRRIPAPTKEGQSDDNQQ